MHLFDSRTSRILAVCMPGLLYASVALSLSSSYCIPQAPVTASPAKAAQSAASEGSAKTANGAVPGQPTAPTPATATHLALLPAPLPASLTQDIDVGARSKSILAHLGEVIRFYRMTVVPIQKTGEPSDMLYAEQSQAAATQVAQLAFQSARGEAALLARVPGEASVENAKTADTESQKLSAAQNNIAKRIQDLQAENDDLAKQISSAHTAALPALQQQKEQVEGKLELSRAMSEAMSKVSGISQANTGLEGNIDQLQHAAPELVDSKIKPVANTLESIGSLRDAGVSSQAVTLFQLLGTQHAIDQRLQEIDVLHDQALDLRTPLLKILKATLAAGEAVQNNPAANQPAAAGSAAAATPASTASQVSNRAELTSTKKTYDELTDAFKTISGVSIPISQEVLLLEQSRGNLLSWRAAVDAERATIMHSLLLRVFLIAITLIFIFIIGEVWRRATTRYVLDLRRRRQLLLVRRMVIGFLSGLVLIFGFVTQFSSLATFAGFITAGIAVGLQTILLSVAAYFFIVGRYGVRVGDRITVAGVTGDVVEVGLVRFYMMELTGTGTELHPTGRIAVFANSVLFQTGTPLYKQIPGTDYAWHEITVKLKADSDYKPALDVIRNAVEKVYESYKDNIQQQHARVESWMDTALTAPGIEARLQLSDGLQYAVLYPVQIVGAGAVDENIVREVVDAMSKNASITQAMEGTPSVRAVIKAN